MDLQGVFVQAGVLLNFNQKHGDHPNFRQNALGVRRHSRSSQRAPGQLFSEQLSEFKIPFSEYEIPFSEWHLTTWGGGVEVPILFLWAWGFFRMKDIFICPNILGAFLRELGWSPHTSRGQKNRQKKKKLIPGNGGNFSDQCSLDFAYFLCLFSGRRSKSSQELCSWVFFSYFRWFFSL